MSGWARLVQRIRTVTAVGAIVGAASAVGAFSLVGASPDEPDPVPVDVADEPVVEAVEIGIDAQTATIGGPLDVAPTYPFSCAGTYILPGPPSCTVFSLGYQTPPGNHVLTQATVRTGPNTGPMRFVAVRAMRPVGTVTSPGFAACCFLGSVSQVFTPPPNQTTTITVNMPMENIVANVEGEAVESIDYLGISILDTNSSLPIAATNAFSPLSMIAPSLDQQPGGSTSYAGPNGILTISGTLCPSASQNLTATAGFERGDAAQTSCARLGGATSAFRGLTPSRLLNTRDGSQVAAGSTTRVSIADREGVPDDAVAAVLNVTAVNPSSKGFLTVFPCGEDRPTASNVNFEAGQNVPNAVVATLGAGGDVCIYSSVSTHLLVDLNGAIRSGFAGFTPSRVLNTRDAAPVVAGSTTRVSIADRAGVPDDAAAAVLNVTAVNPSAKGFLTVFPCGEDRPTASNVNFEAGQNVANAVVATLGDGGDVCVYSSVSTHVLVDLNGAVSSGFAALSPSRLLNTREGTPVAADSVTRVPIVGEPGVATTAIAAVLNVTAVNPSSKGFLTVFPCGNDRPTASNVNFEAGRNVANAVVATLGAADGDVCIYASSSTHLLVDLNGAYT